MSLSFPLVPDEFFPVCRTGSRDVRNIFDIYFSEIETIYAGPLIWRGVDAGQLNSKDVVTFRAVTSTASV